MDLETLGFFLLYVIVGPGLAILLTIGTILRTRRQRQLGRGYVPRGGDGYWRYRVLTDEDALHQMQEQMQAQQDQYDRCHMTMTGGATQHGH